MIRLFRKIRQQLLSESNYGMYILYASGEIILVMLGILLALQVNNWNEERQERQKIIFGLDALREALHEDFESLENGRRVEIFRSYSMQYLLNLTALTSKYFEYTQLNHLPFQENRIWEDTLPEAFNRDFIHLCFAWSGRHSPASINRQVISELESVGIYSQIENKELKRLINEYYRESDLRLASDEDRLCVKKWDNYLLEKGIVYIDISNIEDPLLLFQNNPEASAILKRLIQESRFRAESIVGLIELNGVIVEILDSEISESIQ